MFEVIYFLTVLHILVSDIWLNYTHNFSKILILKNPQLEILSRRRSNERRIINKQEYSVCGKDKGNFLVCLSIR